MTTKELTRILEEVASTVDVFESAKLTRDGGLIIKANDGSEFKLTIAKANSQERDSGLSEAHYEVNQSQPPGQCHSGGSISKS